jgi:hypothetical protein
VTEQTPSAGGAPRPVPDLGFFGNPVAPAGSQPPPPSQFGPPPGQFGPPPGQFGAPPVTPFGAGPQPVYSPYLAVQQRGGMPGWVIALIAGGVSLFIVLVLAAVAIPTFLEQRDRERAEATTTFAWPATIEGLPQSTDMEELASLQDATVSNLPTEARDPQSSIYTDGTTRRIVLVSAFFPRPAGRADMRDLFAGFEDGLASNPPPGVTMSEPFDREPGRLGGRIRCATMSGALSGQFCMAADSASMLTIVDVSPGTPDPDLPRRVRETVVRRGAS